MGPGMRACGRMIGNMARAPRPGLMAPSTKESTKWARNTEAVLLSGTMDRGMWDDSLIII